MVLGLAQCQMAFYLQQKAFEMPRFKQGSSGKNVQSDRPANVRNMWCVTTENVALARVFSRVQSARAQ